MFHKDVARMNVEKRPQMSATKSARSMLHRCRQHYEKSSSVQLRFQANG
jgi:hypothetical protein